MVTWLNRVIASISLVGYEIHGASALPIQYEQLFDFISILESIMWIFEGPLKYSDRVRLFFIKKFVQFGTFKKKIEERMHLIIMSTVLVGKGPMFQPIRSCKTVLYSL